MSATACSLVLYDRRFPVTFARFVSSHGLCKPRCSAWQEGSMNKIIQGIRHFQDEVFPKNKALFQNLASAQKPEALFIACSDSRISLDLITQTAPGDLFVCRNAGNIVPPNGRSNAVSASIE